jgi:hypothetical protein
MAIVILAACILGLLNLHLVLDRTGNDQQTPTSSGPRVTKSRLVACIGTMRGLTGILDKIMRDDLHGFSSGSRRLTRTVNMSTVRGITSPDLGDSIGVETIRSPENFHILNSERNRIAVATGTDDEMFDEAADDNVLLRNVFESIDQDRDKCITKEELNAALRTSAVNQHLSRALLETIKNEETAIDFEEFKAVAHQVWVGRPSSFLP